MILRIEDNGKIMSAIHAVDVEGDGVYRVFEEFYASGRVGAKQEHGTIVHVAGFKNRNKTLAIKMLQAAMENKTNG